MKIAIIAANGRLGRTLVAEALAAGYEVRAGVRHAAQFPANPRLTVVQCDATNHSELRGLMTGCDAVMSAIGHVKGSPATVQTDASKALVQVMGELGIKRFIGLTGSGVRVAGDKISWYDRLLNYSITLIDKPRIEDGRQHQQVLQASQLEWTTVRILMFQSNAAAPVTVSEHGPAKLYVSRQQAAQAMLAVLRDSSFIRQLPIISQKSNLFN